MRSYGQFCGLAKALDVIGDRWSLLIVRELMLRDGCRYTDLREGLPGIATNLLADRLRDLEEAGVVEREDAPPPIATTLYRLTERGRELQPAVLALGRWGAPLLFEAPEDDAFRSHWLAFPLGVVLGDRVQDLRPATIEVRTKDDSTVIEIGDGAVRTRSGTADSPDAVITGSRELAFGVLTGAFPLEDAEARGLTCDGDRKLLKAFQRATSPA